MGTIHFVYVRPGAKPRFESGIAGALERLARAAKRKLVSNGEPLPAPYSITVNLHRFLAERCEVKLYDWREKGILELKPEDILLGHPHPDPETLVQQTMRSGARCRLKALLFPLHHGLPEFNQYAVPLLDGADVVL
ncbi:MAG: hypothetical protein M1451_02205, partial [Acidobacteria bacterium]|nr:hypothetical protein [Acidobacteriota bacterium]